ncbi:VLRF1 family aeRF1-type release factor [Salinicoccus sp. HZC-1]|uniref:VLRF1 family aeRF1-type release factor n=1 Tax=Salinicoccus sp. HZC-1 TaxID=3385497 RepID=UPI00398AB9B8
MPVVKDIKKIKSKQDDIGVLTLYLNTDVTNRNQSNGEWKIHLKNEMKALKEQVKNRENPEELKALKKLLDEAETEIYARQKEMQRGYLLIASADGELWRERILQVPVTTSLQWDNTAQTQQLEELEQRFPDTAIIVVQQADVIFIETALGMIRDEKYFSWDLERQSWLDYEKASPPAERGTGKDEFQRRFSENQQRWYKDLAPRLSKEIKDRKLSGAYLVGSKKSVGELETYMNEAHLKGTISKNLGSMSSHEILKEVYDTLI